MQQVNQEFSTELAIMESPTPGCGHNGNDSYILKGKDGCAERHKREVC